MKNWKKNLEEDKKYFNNYEENRIKLEKKIKESKILNDKLINENEKIIKELDNKKKLINEYASEFDKLNYKHNQKVQKIAKEFNDKDILINKLNKLKNEHEQKVQKIAKELNDKNVSLHKYEENIKKLDNEYKKEIQKLKKELKESKEYIDSNKKDKNIVFKKISELTEENQKYIKEKQKIEQELNKKKQELNNKEHELTNNKIIINDLKYQIKLLKDKENDKLKKIEAKNKIFKDLSMPTKIPQSVRKRDDKARTFALEDFKKDSLPKHNEKSNRLENLENEYQKIYISDLSKLLDIKKDPTKKKIEKLNFEEIKQESKEDKFYRYELNISDSRIKYLDKIIKENPKMLAKKIDIINPLKSLYTMRKDYFKIKIYNPESEIPDLRSLDDQIRDFLFFFFFLSGFSFTTIHESQDCRERGRVFL